MSSLFQPPPTFAEVVLVDERTGKATFNPVWLKWFVNLVGIIDASGGGGGTIDHNSLATLQGGQSNQYYHFNSAEHTALQAVTAGTAALTVASLTATGNVGAVDFNATGNVGGVNITGSGTVQGATVKSTGTLEISDTKLMKTNTNFTNGAAAAVGTLLNAPAAGNPTKWIPVNDNGTTRYIPAW